MSKVLQNIGFVLPFRSIDVNASNVVGETSLHFASRFGFADVVRILLDYGAQVLFIIL